MQSHGITRTEASAARIRVVIAEDHPVYREGVARLIRQRPEFELTAECADGEEALLAIAAAAPDVALLDVRLPGRSGIDVLRQVHANGESRTRVVMLSAFNDGATAYESLAAGASGYLVKDADGNAICDALLAAAHGRTVLSAEVQTGLAGEIRQHSEPQGPALSAREREILRQTAAGRTARQIAAQLFISPATVKTHLQHIYGKLEVSDRASAVAEAIRRGILN